MKGEDGVELPVTHEVAGSNPACTDEISSPVRAIGRTYGLSATRTPPFTWSPGLKLPGWTNALLEEILQTSFAIDIGDKQTIDSSIRPGAYEGGQRLELRPDSFQVL